MLYSVMNLKIGLIVLVVLLVILGIITLINRIREKEIDEMIDSQIETEADMGDKK